MSALFDYHALAGQMGVPPDRLAELEACVRRHHASDEMMFELRMVRTLQAVREGVTTLDEAIAEFKKDLLRGSASPTG